MRRRKLSAPIAAVTIIISPTHIRTPRAIGVGQTELKKTARFIVQIRVAKTVRPHRYETLWPKCTNDFKVKRRRRYSRGVVNESVLSGKMPTSLWSLCTFAHMLEDRSQRSCKSPGARSVSLHPTG